MTFDCTADSPVLSGLIEDIEMHAFHSAAVGIVGLAISASGPLLAETTKIVIPQSSFACLYENQQKYLDLPKNVLIFFPALCPAISREEVASIVQNSSAQDRAPSIRAIMLKSEFGCLVELIGKRLEHGEDVSEDPAAVVEFVLDCG